MLKARASTVEMAGGAPRTGNVFEEMLNLGACEYTARDSSRAAKDLMAVFDRDRDGALDIGELTALARQLFCDESGRPYQIQTDQLKAVFEFFDEDKDGKIGTEEFTKLWQYWIHPALFPVSALVVIDVQNDFISGSLSMSNSPAGQNGGEVVPVINGLLEQVPFHAVLYSLDWHPPDHVSFVENVKSRKLHASSKIMADEARTFDTVIFDGSPPCEQKLWPAHCIQNSWGAKFHPDLKIVDDAVVVHKGTDPDIDSYSAFWDNCKRSQTALHEELSSRNVTDVYVCGLAYEVCVSFTMRHALEYKYRTVLVEDACRGLCLEDMQQSRCQLLREGAAVVHSSKVKAMVDGRDRRPEVAFNPNTFQH